MALEYSKSIERSVDSLQRMYAAIVALAIGQAIILIFVDRSTGQIIPFIKNENGGMSINMDILQHIPVFIALIVTIVPFFHGMNRHLDKCYLEKDENIQGALLFDFFVFFLESALLFGLATAVKSGYQAFVVLGMLLVVDSIWGVISHWIHYSKIKPSTRSWAGNNLVFTILGSVVFLLNDAYVGETKSIILLILAIARTIADYTISWDFYFPKPPETPKPDEGD